MSKQCCEIKLERFPPECGKDKGYNYETEDVTQKRQIPEITFFPEKKSEKLDQKEQ